MNNKSTLTVTLKDGTTLAVNDDFNPETYALIKVMAELADSKEELDPWMSREVGSFYDLYKRWFGKE